MSQKKRKKLLSKTKKNILLIVENSEVDFFKHYFNRYIQDEYGISIKCESSGAGDKCEITNFGKMNRRIERAIEKEGFKMVFLMLDLDTNCSETNTNHKCLVKLKEEYEPKYKIENKIKKQFYLFVVCNEIESWFLTIDKSKNSTNNVNENHKKELMKFLKVNSEPQIVEKMIKELKSGKYQLDFSKNSSLEYFIEKIRCE